MTEPHADGPGSGASVPFEPAATLASPGRRIASGLLDTALLGVALGFVLSTELALASESEQSLFLGFWAFLFAPLFFALYHAYGTGATPGQLELRIGLRDARSAQHVGLGRAIFRAYLGAVFLVLVVPAIVDLLFLLGGRSLRDRLTRTKVTFVELHGKAPELAGPTIPELESIFHPPPGTRRYLRRGWALLRARPRLVLGTVAALYGVLVVVTLILGLLTVADSPDELTIVEFVLFAGLLLGSGIYWTYAAVVVGVEDLRVGGPDASVWATLVRASRRMNALTAALLILLPLVALGAQLLLALVLIGRLSMIPPALVLEDSRVFGAFRRSWRLTKDQTWELFGLYFLSVLLLGGALFLVSLPVRFVSGFHETAGVVVALGLGVATTVVVLAWLGAAWALVYEDSRRARPAGAEVG